MNSSLKKKNNPLSILRMSVGVEKIADIFQKVSSGKRKRKKKTPQKISKGRMVPLKHGQ